VVAVKDIVVTVLTCCGIAIAKWLDYVINLVLNVIKYWNTQFSSFAARCWTIFKGWLSDSFSINIDQWWSSFQKWFTNTNAAKERAAAVSQGARTNFSIHMRR
jgi:flagellar hook-associated protein FlgK